MSGTNAIAQDTFTSYGSQFTALKFLFDQFAAKMWTSTPCVVKSVAPSGTGKAIGTVSVQPLVNQIDGQGNGSPHGIINGVSYFRIQGGQNGIVCDPAVGDTGILLTCMRDISKVVATQAQANPGSFRTYNPADSFYFGGSLGGTLLQYVEFTGSKVVVNAVSEIDFQIGGTTVLAITASGQSSTGSITNNGHRVDSSHLHTGVQTGSGDTGPPV